MRIYLASDFHAAEKAWRKFLNAIKLNVYKADVALLAGDLTGKAIVPIVRNGGAYEAELFGVRRRAGSDEELAVLQRDIADVGFYSFISTSEEAERLAERPAGPRRPPARPDERARRRSGWTWPTSGSATAPSRST